MHEYGVRSMCDELVAINSNPMIVSVRALSFRMKRKRTENTRIGKHLPSTVSIRVLTCAFKLLAAKLHLGKKI